MPLHGFLATPGVTKKKESVHEQHRDQTAPPDRHDRSDQRIPLGARPRRRRRYSTAGAPIPKQCCRILGPRSLLETTLSRIAPLVGAERTLAIINRDHLTLARRQLTGLDARNVLVQPRNLDTGPAVVLSMLEIARRDPDATVAMFPSDHYVRNGDAFRRTIGRMCRLVAGLPQKIALLGVRPERAESGYGYIMPGRALGANGDTFAVRAFHEKPAATSFSRAYPSTWSSREPTASDGAIGARPKRSSDPSRPWASSHRGGDVSRPRDKGDQMEMMTHVCQEGVGS